MMHCNMCWSSDIKIPSMLDRFLHTILMWMCSSCLSPYVSQLAKAKAVACIMFVITTYQCFCVCAFFWFKLENPHSCRTCNALAAPSEVLLRWNLAKLVAGLPQWINRIGPTWVDILRTWSDQCTFGGLLGFQLCKVDTQSWKCIALKIKCIFDIFCGKLMCLKPWVPESLRNLCDWWGINASSVYRINIVTMTQCCFCYSSFYHLCLKSG